MLLVHQVQEWAEQNTWITLRGWAMGYGVVPGSPKSGRVPLYSVCGIGRWTFVGFRLPLRGIARDGGLKPTLRFWLIVSRRRTHFAALPGLPGTKT